MSKEQPGLYISQVINEKARLYDQQCIIREHEDRKRYENDRKFGKIAALCGMGGSILLTMSIPFLISFPFVAGATCILAIWSWVNTMNLYQEYGV